MAEIRCVCGRSIPVPDDPQERLLRCPSCDATHDLKPRTPGSRILLAALVLITLVAVGFLIRGLTKQEATQEPDVQQQADPIEEAKRLFDKGDFPGAIARLRKIVAIEPNDYRAHFLLGLSYQNVRAYDKSEEHLRIAAEAKPEPESRLALARTWLMLGRFAEARDLLEPVHQKTPDARTASLLGDVYSELNRMPDAERLYRQALELEPSSAANVRNLLEVLLLQGKVAEGEEWTRSALPRITSEETRLWVSVSMHADLLREKGDLEGALAKVDAGYATLRKPDLALKKVRLLLEMGKFEDVVKFGTEAQRSMPHSGPYAYSSPITYGEIAFAKVLALLLQNRLDSAKEEADRARTDMRPHSDINQVRDRLDVILLVVGATDRTKIQKMIDRLPPRAVNDHYLFLAAVAFAEGRKAEYRRDLQAAQKSTVGKNFPHFLIESLLKRE